MAEILFPRVGGIQPLTLIDFPGKLASVVFLKGCNLRCSFCHNPSLIDTSAPGEIPWDQVQVFLEERRGFLDGVVFSGGEPTMQKELSNAIEDVRRMGFQVGIQTNGFFPGILHDLVGMSAVSYIALDLKTVFRNYRKITGADCTDPFLESARNLIRSGIPHEFRTTVHPDVVNDEDLLELAEFLLELGARKFVLQRFVSGKTLDPTLRTPKNSWLAPATLKALHRKFPNLEVRGNSTGNPTPTF